MVYSVDERGRLDLNTRVLERNYGDMLTDPQLVYDGAGGMALLFLNAKQEAERQERYSAVRQLPTRPARDDRDSGNENRSGSVFGENPPLISQRSALREAWVQDLRESGVQSRQPKVSCVPKSILFIGWYDAWKLSVSIGGLKQHGCRDAVFSTNEDWLICTLQVSLQYK